MKRIDPNEIAAWFKAHPDIRPVQERFALFDGEKLAGCCIITSRFIGEDEPDLKTLRTFDTNCGTAYSAALEKTGMSSDYVQGVIQGWDHDRTQCPGPENNFIAGRHDGCAAYLATTKALTEAPKP